MLLLVAVVGLTTIGAVTHRTDSDRQSAAGDTPANVVDYTGTDGVKFGTTSGDLARQYGLTRKAGDCAPSLPGHPLVSPVFVNDKLALLWVSAPAHTPEGITVGSTVSQVQAAYPQATRLAAPSAYQYPGLMATSGDKAYLFLYSGEQVSKMIVGYQQYVQQLYQSGGDTC